MVIINSPFFVACFLIIVGGILTIAALMVSGMKKPEKCNKKSKCCGKEECGSKKPKKPFVEID